jgi:hypothetical protein
VGVNAETFNEPEIGLSMHCCDRMDFDLNQRCDIHRNRFDCPDALINAVRGGYGLIVHDGGASFIEMGFCPWCGTRLPRIGDPFEATTT